MVEKLKIILSIILFCFCFNSCKTDTNESNSFNEPKIKQADAILLSPPMKKGEINMKDIVEEINIVPLETTTESLIGYIEDIQFDNGFIFIADRKTNELLIFSIDGHFVTKISALGNGSEEYVSFNGFDIDKDNNIIYLLDGTKGNILQWNYCGEYLGHTDLPFKNIDTFIYAGNNSFYVNFGFRQDDFNKSSPHNLILYNAISKQIESSFFPFDFNLFQLRILDNSLFFKNENNIYYRTLFGNKIYKIEKDSLIEMVECDFGEYQIPFDCYFLTNKEFKKIQEEKLYSKLGKFLDFDKWIYIRIDRSRMSGHYFYDKKIEKGYLDISHIMSKSNFISQDIYKYDENTFCGWINPEQIFSFDKYSNDEIVSDDNPILIFYKLK